jgi:hypothetical protein
MGRKQSRKRERRAQRRDGRWGGGDPGWADSVATMLREEDLALLLEFEAEREGLTATGTCGRCREFVQDDVGGRGECLHPGSGILKPWPDTEACPFFSGRR